MDAVNASEIGSLAQIFHGHAWIAALLLLVAMLLFWAYKLSQNQRVLDLVSKYGVDHGASLEALKTSVDSLKTEQGELVTKVAELEAKVDQFACSSAPGCPQRVKG